MSFVRDRDAGPAVAARQGRLPCHFSRPCSDSGTPPSRIPPRRTPARASAAHIPLGYSLLIPARLPPPSATTSREHPRFGRSAHLRRRSSRARKAVLTAAAPYVARPPRSRAVPARSAVFMLTRTVKIELPFAMQPKSRHPLRRIPTWLALSAGIMIGLFVAKMFSAVSSASLFYNLGIYAHHENKAARLSVVFLSPRCARISTQVPSIPATCLHPRRGFRVLLHFRALTMSMRQRFRDLHSATGACGYPY